MANRFRVSDNSLFQSPDYLPRVGRKSKLIVIRVAARGIASEGPLES
jgi:hypothetical protein